MMDCKQATELMSHAHDRALTWGERIKLRLHLMICRGCNNYNQHLNIISEAMKLLRGRFK
ncbi:MAG: zf-HC2 domain-containing protein [Gammaproteobacteria bacterium]